jgi:RNA polymerase sigma factor (sigma-70 family)
MYQDRAQRQRRQLAAELYAERRDYLLAIARRHAHTEADAAEALQEAFASFLRAFDPERGAPPLAWLTLTLKRQCWRQRRAAHLDRRFGQEAERGGDPGSFLEGLRSLGPEPGERVSKRDDARLRLAQLKPDQRTALGLFAVGYSYREIAAYCGWTYTKVNRCICEGRAALRRAEREAHGGAY